MSSIFVFLLKKNFYNRFNRNGSGFIEYYRFKNFLFFDPYPNITYISKVHLYVYE